MFSPLTDGKSINDNLNLPEVYLLVTSAKANVRAKLSGVNRMNINAVIRPLHLLTKCRGFERNRDFSPLKNYSSRRQMATPGEPVASKPSVTGSGVGAVSDASGSSIPVSSALL